MHIDTAQQVLSLKKEDGTGNGQLAETCGIKFQSKSVSAFCIGEPEHWAEMLLYVKEQYVQEGTVALVRAHVCVCVYVWLVSLCRHIYVYMLKINTGYITPCDPAAHLSPASSWKRSVQEAPLIGRDVAEPAEVVMATWFYLDHYSHCNTTINSLYAAL